MNKETKHTPGPWVFDNREYGDLGFAINGPRETVAVARDDYKPRDEARANAHLIAAAPDLLEALKALEPYLPNIAQVKDEASLNDGRASSWGVAAINARAAIAKAEGK